VEPRHGLLALALMQGNEGRDGEVLREGVHVSSATSIASASKQPTARFSLVAR
jgi:hypothetical protein